MRISDWSSDVCSSDLLQMVSIIDVLDTGLSSVYTFFDPDAAGSLGTYGVLWQLDLCRSLQLPWLYLATGSEKAVRSEEHTSELQSLLRISNAVFSLINNN